MVMEKNTASSTNAELEIVHAVRGRMRLRLKGDDARELLSRIADHLQQQVGINVVQIKPTSNSLVVTFDPDAISMEQLIGSLQSSSSIEISAEAIARSTGESHAMTEGRLLSLVPPLVGLGIARGLKVSGWKSILTYILAAGVTREVIDQVTGESEKSANVELSPAKLVSITEVKAEEISTLLTAIETDYEIVHHIPGRVRLRVPRISRDRSYALELKYLLEQDSRIIEFRCNTQSSSVVILYDPKALADSIPEKKALDDSKGKVDKSESSTIPDQKTSSKKPATKSDLNDTPPADNETFSDSKSLTSEIEAGTRDTLETEVESTTPIADGESEPETHQEFSNGQTVIEAGYWSTFKSSMLLTMLQLMGNMQVQTAEI